MKFVATKKCLTKFFFSPLYFLPVFGSGIRDPRSNVVPVIISCWKPFLGKCNLNRHPCMLLIPYYEGWNHKHCIGWWNPFFGPGKTGNLTICMLIPSWMYKCQNHIAVCGLLVDERRTLPNTWRRKNIFLLHAASSAQCLLSSFQCKRL